jgi:hypothetical protein
MWHYVSRFLVGLIVFPVLVIALPFVILGYLVAAPFRCLYDVGTDFLGDN